MEAQSGRTWLCSVVFLDIVAYSKRHVAGQLRIKEHLNRLIQHALSDVHREDVIILDSGDGAAACFLADPVEALFFALGVHSSLTGSDNVPRPEYTCRMGINLGPVKVIRDVNGRRNTIGDGINSAQRVMDFAKPGQLLVSRSFHDVIACLSEEYNNLFSYLGIRHDKHVKEYDIYEVSTPVEELIKSAQRPPDIDTAPAGDIMGPASVSAQAWDDGILDHATRVLAERIGPLAKVLVRRAAKRACGPQDLYEMLAQHLPAPGLRDLFIQALSNGEPGRAAGHLSVGNNGSSPGAKPPAGAGIELTDEVRERLRHRLAESLGPLAKVIVKRAINKADDEAGFCDLLARELPEDKQRDFAAYAMQLLEQDRQGKNPSGA